MSSPTAGPGTTVTYTLSYGNYGCTATNVVITDILPPNVTYVDGSATGNITVAAPTYQLWQAKHAYTVGDTVARATANGFYYTCTVAGTSGYTQPSWPTSNGATVTDGGVTWTANQIPVELMWVIGALGDGTTGDVTFEVTVNSSTPLGNTIGNTASISCTEIYTPVSSNTASFTTGNWWMFHHDQQHTGYCSFPGPATPAVKWSNATGNQVWSSPAIGSDGTVYIGSTDNNLYAYKPDGTLKWSFATGGAIYSSPAIGNDGTVYIGSSDTNVYAVVDNGAFAAKKWSYATGGAIYSSPAIDAIGQLYIGSEDNKLYALRTTGSEAGALVWSSATNASIYSSPALTRTGRRSISAQPIKACMRTTRSMARWRGVRPPMARSTPPRLWAGMGRSTSAPMTKHLCLQRGWHAGMEYRHQWPDLLFPGAQCGQLAGIYRLGR